MKPRERDGSEALVPWCAADGSPLRVDTTCTLTDGQRRWPVVAGIPWLRAGHDDVRECAVAALDAGDLDGAAVVLLADADDWWDEPPPPAAQLRAVLRAGTLSEAIELIGLGRVGTYFRHRWSDPSWLAALALTAAHPPADRSVVDLACGAGHLLRHLALHGHLDLMGVDVVFAKLWLARRFVLPPDTPVELVCADLTAPWPLPPPERPRYVACHDALYFLPDKQAFVAAARKHAGEDGAVLLGHCHNALHPAGAAGLPLDPDSWVALLPGAHCYAEEELTAAALTLRTPRSAEPATLAGTEALGLAFDGAAEPPDLALLRPAPGVRLRPNPLYVTTNGSRVRRWPHERWAAEYGPRAATYLPQRWEPLSKREAVRRRLLLDLPERW
jgi:SAM-dependent methyltransferase